MNISLALYAIRKHGQRQGDARAEQEYVSQDFPLFQRPEPLQLPERQGASHARAYRVARPAERNRTVQHYDLPAALPSRVGLDIGDSESSRQIRCRELRVVASSPVCRAPRLPGRYRASTDHPVRRDGFEPPCPKEPDLQSGAIVRSATDAQGALRDSDPPNLDSQSSPSATWVKAPW